MAWNAATVWVVVLALAATNHQLTDAKKTLQLTFFAFQNPRGTLYTNGTLCDNNGGCKVAISHCLEPLSSATADVRKCGAPAWSKLNYVYSDGDVKPWPASNFLSLWSLTKPVFEEMQFGCMRGFRLKLYVEHCTSSSYCRTGLYIDEYLLDIPENSAFANLTLSGLRPLNPTSYSFWPIGAT